MTDALSRLKAALADHYEIEREIGRGGMATVYLAEDLKHRRKVAIKVVRPELAQALGADRFHREIEIAANLNHPHILPLLDSGTAEEQPTAEDPTALPPYRPTAFLYYVMPYVEGQSLRDKLAKEGELPIADAVRILRDVVEALKHAHKHNVVHRDIKPDNVMLAEDHALVTDFGVAKAVSDATGAIGLTTEGVALGTPAYMSPEQASADPHIDHRADIYAVGVIAYELLTGRTPFVGNTQQELLAAHVTETPDPVTKYRESVPPALAQLVMKCLAKKAADRWQTAEELLPQLEALATPSGGVTPTGTMPVDRITKRRWLMAGGAVAVAVTVAIIAVVAVLPRGSGVRLDPERIVVAPFRNETGDPSLDQLGSRAGHWVTQGLQQAAIHVTPWDGALQAWQYVQSEVEAGRVRDPIRALAEETGAGTVVSGAVYMDNDSLEIHANVTDAVLDQPLGTIDPIKVPQVAASEIIAEMRQRVVGFLAIAFDERISDRVTAVARPPSFEAYREFDQGLEIYLRIGNSEQATRHLERAFELDTTFATPLIYAILTHNNRGEWAQSDSLIGILELYRDRLSDYDRNWIDYLKARVDGDQPEALRAIRRAAQLAPGSKAVYNRAFMARRNNRPQEAVDALLTVDPERGPMRGWISYYDVLVQSYLDLDELQEALKAAQEYRENYGDDPHTLGRTAMTLIALGRVEQANRVVEDLIALPEQGPLVGTFLHFIAAYSRRLGHTEFAHTTIERAIRWSEARTPETRAREGWRYDHAWALYLADSCDAAYGVSKPLSEQFPGNISYQGLVGVLAACRGDRAEALGISRWLETLERPFLHGGHTIWRSRIAGALGDGASAVALWRQAFAEGSPHPAPWFPVWVCFEPIADYEPWQELIRPKG